MLTFISKALEIMCKAWYYFYKCKTHLGLKV